MSKLLLKSGGVLEYSRWNTDTQSDEISDVSDIAIRFLDRPIEFAEDIILKDIFLLINQNLDFFDLVFGNWIRQYTEQALIAEPEEEEPDENPLDYLRLYWNIGVENGEFEAMAWPDFDGVGIARVDGDYFKIGDKVHYGIDFCPVQNNAMLPLKFEDEVNFYISAYDYDPTKRKNRITNSKTETFKYKIGHPTLYQAIQGIIWELSWYGNPTVTQSERSDLKESLKRILAEKKN